MKKRILTFVILIACSAFSQNKNILISSKYDFQDNKNSYNINNMLKAILTSNNYTVYFEDELLPIEIAQNRCNALVGVLVDNSNLFSTKIKLQIKDCQNNLLFETAEVKSKEKNIQAGYIEAIKLLSPEIKKYKPATSEKKNQIELPSENITNTKVTYQIVETSNDIRLVSSDLKFVINLFSTRNPSIFIAKNENKNGIFTFITKNKGIFEYYANNKLVVEEYLF